MKAVGISDLLARRECPRRAAYGARRHTGKGEQNHQLMTPEAREPGAAFGSLVHDAIELTEQGIAPHAAVDRAWSRWGAVLAPEDLQRAYDDMEIYRQWTPDQVEDPLLVEGEIRVPLTETDDGEEIWFRAKIDRLYRSVLDPGWFVHVDYKTSKWTKTQTDVDEDLQMWAYNWGLHEYFPEIEHLEQIYQQFEGTPLSTRKNDEQRRWIHDWLAAEAREYFRPVELMDDGLPAPQFNEWCPWCPILESCPIIPELSEWAITRIAELADKDSGFTPIEKYIWAYDSAQTALKILERYTDSVKKLVRQVPPERQANLGFKVTRRNNSVISPTSKHALLEALGEERFLLMARVSQEALKHIDDDQLRQWALGLYEKAPGAEVVTRKAK